jgi:hypothetical protein
MAVADTVVATVVTVVVVVADTVAVVVVADTVVATVDTVAAVTENKRIRSSYSTCLASILTIFSDFYSTEFLVSIDSRWHGSSTVLCLIKQTPSLVLFYRLIM